MRKPIQLELFDKNARRNMVDYILRTTVHAGKIRPPHTGTRYKRQFKVLTRVEAEGKKARTAKERKKKLAVLLTEPTMLNDLYQAWYAQKQSTETFVDFVAKKLQADGITGA